MARTRWPVYSIKSLAGLRRVSEQWTHKVLKPVAFKRIHAARFRSLFLCMSSSQNRCTVLGDMH
ncbi:hypothetical protein CO656_11780 [Sinorhizobium sp. FG01]|nr:hypothetical protein CO656_11780 [Sinorhizobium sp. FG01]